MIRLEPGQLYDVVSLSESFDDPFKLVALLKEHGGDRSSIEYLGASEDAFSALLEGHDDSCRDAIGALLRRRPTQMLDRITAELVAAIGCDPATACAAAIVLDTSIEIQEGATDDQLLFLDESDPPDSPTCQTRIWVADMVEWDSTGRLRIELPETLKAASVGRMLRDVVSHPVLDRHPLRILSIHDDGSGNSIQTDADRTPLDADAILAMRPC